MSYSVQFTRRMFVKATAASFIAIGGGAVLGALRPGGLRPVVAAPRESTLERARRQGFITAAYTNAAPFGFSDRPGNVTGADIETLKVILPRIGIREQQFVIVPFGTLIPGIQAGRFDLLAISMGILPARCQQVEFTEPTNCIGSGFAVKKGNPLNLHSYEDIARNSNARLAVVTGGAEVGFARAAGVPDSQIVSFEGQPQALGALRAGRADAIALTAMGIIGLLRAASDPNLENALPFRDPIIGGRRSELCGGFAVRKEDTDFRDAMNELLLEMKTDGRLKEIYTKFDFRPEMIPGIAQEHTKARLCQG